MERRKTAFLCSRITPDAVNEAVGRWLEGLSPDADCVMCGNHSPMERVVFDRLLKNKIPAILVLAEALHEWWDEQISTALREGRLLIITHCDDDVHTVSSHSAFDRNILMLSIADSIVVGFCNKGGNLERVLVGYDNVTYLFAEQEEHKRKTVLGSLSQHSGNKESHLKNNGFWSRTHSFANGDVTIELNGYGKETYLKIVQKDDSSSNDGLGERLTFSRLEFSNFYNALKHIRETFNASDDSHESVVIKSESGDVTVEFVPDDDCGTWTFTQGKLLVTKVLRSHTIKIKTSGFPAFCDLLGSAAQQWRL